MIKRIQTALLVLMAIVGSASAQSVSVRSIEVQTDGQTEVVVSLSEGTTATALQFNLQLPDGLTANTGNATLGSATDSHTLCIETLDNGDWLFILYSMNLKTFKDGELLRIPVTAGNTATTTAGQLYSIRTASFSGENAVSHPCADSSFGIIVKPLEDGIDELDASKEMRGENQIIDLSGRRMEQKPAKGIYIQNRKKVLVK